MIKIMQWLGFKIIPYFWFINHLVNSYYVNPIGVRIQKAIRSRDYNLLLDNTDNKVTCTSSDLEKRGLYALASRQLAPYNRSILVFVLKILTQMLVDS